MSILALRDYQADAIVAVRQDWAAGVRRPAIVLPTGAGKTVVFAHIVLIMHGLGVLSLILVHRDELLSQAVDKLAQVAPDLQVGVVKASRFETVGVDVIVASVQSLAGINGAARRAELARAGVRLVIVDEAHHAVADSYMTVLRDLGCWEADRNQGAYALGVTATLGRTDRVALGQVWENVPYKRDIIEMIREGYLVNAKGIRVRIEGLDLRSVARSRGDWRDGALSEAMHAAMAPAAVARAYVEHCKDRQGILFAPDVAMAYEMATALGEAGIVAEGIDGAMRLDDRRAVLRRFARGETQVVCNCMILTEGFDAPWCSAVVIARPTSSGPLYVQMAGRALRPYPGKSDALIMDVVGVTGRHKLASMVDLAGADRVEALPDDLAEYDELDLLALDEQVSGWGAPQPERVDGTLTHEIVELFGLSRSAWLRTERGVWFLSAGEDVVFIAPASDPGAYSVARVPMHRGGGEWLREGVDLSMAMSWGEQYAAESGSKTLTQRKAPWRRSLELRTQQVTMAAKLDISVAEGMTRGELSDAISHRLASMRIDVMPCVAGVTQAGYW
jgi:superfamily II DNA or RNA helicase